MPRALKIFQDSPAAFPLDDIQVASPCPANWADMVGSDKVRFCASCQKNVFNLSGMKRDEAIDLVRATEGRVCVRFFRRADGSVLTEDCPVGIAAVLRRAKRMTYAAAALSLGAVAALLAVLGGGLTRRTCQRIDDVKQTIEQTMDDMPMPPPMMGAPVANPAPEPEPMMGKIEARPTMGEMAAPIEMKGDVAPAVREIKGRMARPVPPPPVTTR